MNPSDLVFPDASWPGARFLIIEARYYETLADQLLQGARDELDKTGGNVTVVTVPGALELPIALAISLHQAEETGPYDGVVALGCVIRGETAHYDIVAGESARALMDFAVSHRLPFGNAILTVENEDQAWARKDKGRFAARAMLSLLQVARLSKAA